MKRSNQNAKHSNKTMFYVWITAALALLSYAVMTETIETLYLVAVVLTAGAVFTMFMGELASLGPIPTRARLPTPRTRPVPHSFSDEKMRKACNYQ